MAKPRIRHIAINVQDREKVAEFYVRAFGLEEKERGANGTIYLSDGFVDVALICNPKRPWGIQHFGFQVDKVNEIEEIASAPVTQAPPRSGIYGEYKITDPEGNQVDLSEEGWPV